MDKATQEDMLGAWRVLIFEDDLEKRSYIAEILKKEGVISSEEGDAEKVVERIASEEPDFVLLGGRLITEEETTRLESIAQECRNRGIPLFLLVPKDMPEGPYFRKADDWLTYPISRYSLLGRLSLHKRMKALKEEVENMEKVLLYIAQTVEMKELYGREHPQRVAKVAMDIGELFDLDEPSLGDLKMGALLHDIGKVGVPEPLLTKPGRLTPPEYEEVKRHAVIGERLCRPVGFLQGAIPVIRHHHERWDGGGYPDGLSGEDIPFLARIVSVADAFVAFTSDRPFRKAFTKGEVLSILVGGAGSYWDPSVIWALLRILPR